MRALACASRISVVPMSDDRGQSRGTKSGGKFMVSLASLSPVNF